MATENSSHYVNFDEYIEFQIEKARNQIRWTDILTAGTGIGVLVLAYLLVFTVLDHWIVDGGFSDLTRGMMLLLLALAVGTWVVWRLVIPFRRQVNALFAARVLESAEPRMSNSLLTLLDLRRAHRNVAPEIQQALEKHTAVRLSEMDIDQSIDRRMLLRLSYALLLLVVVCCAYTVLSPKRISFLRPLSTVAAPVATQTEIVDVRPGDADVVAGTQLEVEVDLRGEPPSEVYLLYSTDDRQIVNERVELRVDEEGLMQYGCLLNGPRGQGIQTPLTYHVVAGDARSSEYHVTVSRPPTAAIDELRIEFPEYMQFEPRTQSEGTIDAWDGSTVSLTAKADQDVVAGRILFFANANDQRPVGEFPLQVSGRELRYRWTLDFAGGEAPSSYALTCRTEAGEETRQPPRYTINVRPDEAPEVFLDPAGEYSRPANAVIPLAVQASDPDFLLREVTLVVRRDDRELHRERLFDGFTAPMRRRFPMTRRAIDLSKLRLQPDDVVTVTAEARDNKPELGQVGRSRPLTIRITGQLADEERRREQFQEEKQEQDERLKSELNEQRSDEPRAVDEPAESRPAEPAETRSETEPESTEQEPQDTASDDDAEGSAGEGGSDSSGSGAGGEGKQSDSEKSESGSDRQSDDGESQGAGSKANEAEALRQLIEQEIARQEEQAGSETGSSEQQDQTAGTDAAQQGSGSGSSQDPQQESSDARGGTEPDDAETEAPSSNATDTGEASDSTDEQRPNSGMPTEPTSADQQPSEASQSQPEDAVSQPTAGGSDADRSESSDLPPEPDRDPRAPMPSVDGSDTKQSDTTDTSADMATKDRPPGETPPSPSAGESDSGEASSGQPASDQQSKGATQSDQDGPDSPATSQPISDNSQPGAVDDSQPSQSRSQDGSGNPETSGQPSPQSDPSERPAATNATSSPNDDQPQEADQPMPTNQTSPNQATGQQDSRTSPAGSPQNAPGNQPSPQGTSSPSGQPAAEGSRPSEGTSTTQEGSQQPGGSESSSQPSGGGTGEQPANQPGQPGARDSTNAPGTDDLKPSAGQDSAGKPQSESAGSDSTGGTGSGQSSESNEEMQPDGSPGATPNPSGPGSETSSGSAPQPGQAGQPGQGTSSSAGAPSAPSSGNTATQSGPGAVRGGNEQGEPGNSERGSGKTVTEDPNLEYTKQAANLVLRRLEEQLERGDVDPELLKQLGWTQADLARFTDTLRNQLRADRDTQTLDDTIQRRQFEQTLKSFEIRAPGERQRDEYRQKGKRVSTNVRKLPVPPRYRERFEAFSRSVSE